MRKQKLLFMMLQKDDAYDEDEGETSDHFLLEGFQGKKDIEVSPEEKKDLTKSCAGRSCDMGTDSPFTQWVETKVGV
ncbi:hypothetical protein Vadar_009379 [Vaccinium darrowii]|uniref:Uncharacterized protein n=1 Tax=Vaccinium darrowii TaxID=229202 RepID=A0ACB7X9N7_9ERIC|nr:hypothetical protein Vadar_009379 [Vaccinium darrowii]